LSINGFRKNSIRIFLEDTIREGDWEKFGIEKK
jgi:hypothetical protein